MHYKRLILIYFISNNKILQYYIYLNFYTIDTAIENIYTSSLIKNKP